MRSGLRWLLLYLLARTSLCDCSVATANPKAATREHRHAASAARGSFLLAAAQQQLDAEGLRGHQDSSNATAEVSRPRRNPVKAAARQLPCGNEAAAGQLPGDPYTALTRSLKARARLLGSISARSEQLASQRSTESAHRARVLTAGTLGRASNHNVISGPAGVHWPSRPRLE